MLSILQTHAAENAQVQRQQDSAMSSLEAVVTPFAVETQARAKDWFEFILDLSLLDRHLSLKQVEPSGSTLIVQFLYHANMTEQIYNNSALIKNAAAPVNTAASTASSPTPPLSPAVSAPNGAEVVILSSNPANPTPANPNPVNNSAVELKLKRIRLLRTLSLKTAALLDWDLIKFENE